MMNPVNKHTVLKTVRESGSWSGYIAPNKAYVPSVWGIEMPLKITSEKSLSTDELVYYCEFGEAPGPFQTRKLDDVLSEFEYYNCNNELGRRVKFWED